MTAFKNLQWKILEPLNRIYTVYIKYIEYTLYLSNVSNKSNIQYTAIYTVYVLYMYLYISGIFDKIKTFKPSVHIFSKRLKFKLQLFLLSWKLFTSEAELIFLEEAKIFHDF